MDPKELRSLWERGRKILQSAAMKGDVETIEYLVSLGEPVEGKDAMKKTALMYAARFGHAKAAQALLAAGANANYAQPPHGTTALLYATQAGHAAVVATLLQGGAGANVANGHGQTALRIACQQKDEDTVKELLAGGANVHHRNQDHANDALGSTPLTHAAQHGTAAIVKLLLGAGADVHAFDSSGATALMLACAHGTSEMCEELLEAGADVNHTTTRLTCLYAAVKTNYCPDVLEVVETLVAAGAHINASVLGSSVLSEAARRGDPELVDLLLTAGADVDDAREAKRPLFAAAQHNRPVIVAMLLAAGADPNARDARGMTPLQLAGGRGHPTIVKLLTDAGADTDGPKRATTQSTERPGPVKAANAWRERNRHDGQRVTKAPVVTKHSAR